MPSPSRSDSDAAYAVMNRIVALARVAPLSGDPRTAAPLEQRDDEAARVQRGQQRLAGPVEDVLHVHVQFR